MALPGSLQIEIRGIRGGHLIPVIVANSPDEAIPITGTETGGTVAITDPILEILKGNIPGSKVIRAMGERENILQTANGEDLWRGNQLSNVPAAPASTTLIPQPPAIGEQMTLISESDEDGAAGNTGALTVTIEYLDANGDEQTETITMNGLAAVNTDATNIRFVNAMYVSSVGSNSVAVGNIRIYRFGANTIVYNMIYEGGNMSLVPHRMVPRAKTLYVREWVASESNAKNTVLRIRSDCTPDGVLQAGSFLFKGTVFTKQTIGQLMPVHFVAPAVSVVKISGWSIAAAGANAAVDWWGVLVDD